MRTWEEIQEAEAQEKALDAKVRAAWRAFERLTETTPEEARDEQGWTPELLAAARRHSRASAERSEHWIRESERIRDDIAEYEADRTKYESEQT